MQSLSSTPTPALGTTGGLPSHHSPNMNLMGVSGNTPGLAARRHTVGPAHTSATYTHQMELDYSPGVAGLQPLQLLPDTNLNQHLPLVQFQPPHNFTIKDQHLLKPPPVMGASKYFPHLFTIVL